MKKIFILLFIFFFINPKPIFATNTFWPIQSIDTMKYSRDRSREPDIKKKIPLLVKKVADLGINYIAIATPYDEEFYPVLKIWVEEARKNNLKIWFRGNFSAWEGWFDYPKFSNPESHHLMTYQFIISHPELFEKDDIFTPAPEPENGGYGDPRKSPEQKKMFLNFLINSYNNCQHAFQQINKKITCGYFSTNGDVAKDILTKEVIEKIGNIVVIDHYVLSPIRLRQDIELLHEKFSAPIILGEFGAPIPSIHGEMTEQEQALYIEQMFFELLKIKNILFGINYWTAFNGSTTIFDSNLNPKLSYKTVKNFLSPVLINGKILDIFNQPLKNVKISYSKSLTSYSDENSNFKILVPNTNDFIVFNKVGLISSKYLITNKSPKNNLKIILDYSDKNALYYFKKIFNKISS